jgi:hypothetical protein
VERGEGKGKEIMILWAYKIEGKGSSKKKG